MLLGPRLLQAHKQTTFRSPLALVSIYRPPIYEEKCFPELQRFFPECFGADTSVENFSASIPRNIREPQVPLGSRRGETNLVVSESAVEAIKRRQLVVEMTFYATVFFSFPRAS